MTKRIFRAIMSVSLLVCLAGMATVFGVLYRYFDSQLSEEVKNEAEYLAAAVESYGLDVLQDLPFPVGEAQIFYFNRHSAPPFQ